MRKFTAVPNGRGVVNGGEFVERVFNRSAHDCPDAKPNEADDHQNSGDDHGDFGPLSFIPDGDVLCRHAWLIASSDHVRCDLLLENGAWPFDVRWSGATRRFAWLAIRFISTSIVGGAHDGTPRGRVGFVHGISTVPCAINQWVRWASIEAGFLGLSA